jgi:hypothetical protein
MHLKMFNGKRPLTELETLSILVDEFPINSELLGCVYFEPRYMDDIFYVWKGSPDVHPFLPIDRQ